MRKRLREAGRQRKLNGPASCYRGGSESTLRSLFKHPRELVIVAELDVGGSAAFYTYTTSMQKILRLSVGLGDANAAGQAYHPCFEYTGHKPGGSRDFSGRFAGDGDWCPVFIQRFLLELQVEVASIPCPLSIPRVPHLSQS